ncbi:MAG: 23S rRNA (guanosine(2251)-2'-O)-methyltransferase RlmB [Aeriscardovia sp.]|nr:23S rRNA (guanosine(2251)-2'-O)-methyltransferase RlmB [Aeriscardovia sp.]
MTTSNEESRSVNGVGKHVIGSGGRHRKSLRGHGPTPKAEDRVYHKAHKAKVAHEKRQAASPRLAAQRRADRRVTKTDEIVIGRNAVVEALRARVPASELYIATRLEQDDRTRNAIRIASQEGLSILEADRLEIDRIARSRNHQGIVLKIKPYQYADLSQLMDKAENQSKALGTAPLFIALDGVTDAQNLGAVIRSAAAFGADGIILPERRAASMTAGAWKVSAGAAAHLPVARVTNLNRTLDEMHKRGYYAIGLDGGGVAAVGKTGFESDPLVIVLGSEGKGINHLTYEKCDVIAGIPISAQVESLNASVAAGISLYATTRARHEAKNNS